MNMIPEQVPIPMDVAGPPFAFTALFALLALLMLAGLVAVVTLVILAIVKNRPGLAALAGGPVLLGLLGMLLLVAGWIYLQFSPQATHVSTEWRFGVPVAGEVQFAAPEVPKIEHGINLQPIDELEERFTAPKIPLPPEPSDAPPPPEETDSEDAASAVDDVESNEIKDGAPDESPSQPSAVPPAEAAAAAKELAAGLASFGKAMSRVFDEYAEAASADATGPAEAVAAAPEPPPAKRRPEWVDDPPKRLGYIWREVLEAGEYATTEECYRAADALLLLKTFGHVQRLTGAEPFGEQASPRNFDLFSRGKVSADGRFILSGDGRVVWNDSRIQQLYSAGITPDFVRREIVKDEHLETAERSFGPMKRLYTLVEFTPAVDRELRRRWDTHRRQERLATVSVGAGSVLGLLLLAWGVLKIDTLTNGYYTKRLFIGVPAAIIGLVTLLVLLN